MSAPAIFDYSGQQVRTVLIDGEAWFVAADVARVLGYSATVAMTRRLDDDDKGVQILHTPGGDQEMTVISEAGLYVAVIGSQLPQAKDFKRWVTHEVLPSVRRTGSYGKALELDLANQDHVRLIVQAGHAALSRAVEAEAKVAELEPAADAWTALADPAGDFSIREAAQVLTRDDGISIGQNRLFTYLRDIRWIDQSNAPYQSQVDVGRLVRRVTDYTDDFGQRFVKVQPRITPKGLAELRKRLSGPGGADLTALPGGAA